MTRHAALRIACASALLFAACGRAEASDRDRDERENEVVASRKMIGDAAYGFRGAARTQRSAPGTPGGVVAFGAEMHGMLTLVAHRLGPAIAADLDLGSAPPYLFAYGFHVHPLGLGIALGTRGSFVATAGLGFGGITAAQRADLELPLDARLALDLDERVRVSLGARAFFTPDGRDHLRASVGDETRIGIGARFGRTWVDDGMSDAGGYFFRLERVERLGTSYLGLFVGYELGGAF